MLAVSVTVLLTVDLIWVHMANAALLAFTSVQLSFLGHDLGHKQVFRSNSNNERLGLLVSLLVASTGVGGLRSTTNTTAIRTTTAKTPTWTCRLWPLGGPGAGQDRHLPDDRQPPGPPLLPPPLPGGNGPQNIRRPAPAEGRAPLPVAEPAMMAGHISGYLGAVFLAMPVWEGLIFILVNQMLMGLYIGSTFAPNHKGMLMLGPRKRAGLPEKAGADLPERQAQPAERLPVRRTELPDRTPPVSWHAPAPSEAGTGNRPAILRGTLGPVPRDRRGSARSGRYSTIFTGRALRCGPDRRTGRIHPPKVKRQKCGSKSSWARWSRSLPE